jgi:hypothetical protein
VRDRRKVPLGSEHRDGFASRGGCVVAQIARVQDVGEHEQRRTPGSLATRPSSSAA